MPRGGVAIIQDRPIFSFVDFVIPYRLEAIHDQTFHDRFIFRKLQSFDGHFTSICCDSFKRTPFVSPTPLQLEMVGCHVFLSGAVLGFFEIFSSKLWLSMPCDQ